MQAASELLSFCFSPNRFKQSAERIFTPVLKQLFENHIDELQKLTKQIGETIYKPPDIKDISHIFIKFKTAYRRGSLKADFVAKQDIRRLSYRDTLLYSEQNLPSIFSQIDELNTVIALLQTNWRDSFILGLTRCLMEEWETPNKKSLERLRSLIAGKLKKYNGTRPTIKSMKNNLRFLERENGHLILGAELAAKRNNINHATKYMTLPDSWLGYQYFSNVIVAYYEKRKQSLPEIFSELEEVLKKHNSDITDKRLISKLIIQCNNNFTELQDKIKSLSFQEIGDPGIVSSWSAFKGATKSEENELKQARSILNEWITRQFINVFFEKCINDIRRKRFWMRYSKKITDFRVFGNYSIKAILKADERISEFVDSRYNTTRSSSNVAAFMLVIGNYKLVEFSDPGYAFYAYKKDNPKAPQFDKRYHSVEELRCSDMLQLVYRRKENINSSNPEGNLPHKDGMFENGSTLEWERVFDWWIKKYVGVNV